jgi:DNA replication protein DnaC
MTLLELMETLPEHLAKIGVPLDVRKVANPGPRRMTMALEAVDWFATTSWPMLFLLGGNGAGKTFAACSYIARHCVDNSRRGFLEKPGDMLPWWIWRGAMFMRADRIAALSAISDEDQATLKQLRASSLLIIDELGIEDGDGERGIGRLLCDRLDNDGRRTIVTSNLSAGNLFQRYGNRLRSRLHPSAMRVVHGPDLRQEPKREERAG